MKQKRDPSVIKPPPLPTTSYKRLSPIPILKTHLTVVAEPILPYTLPSDLMQRNFLERSIITLEFALRSIEFSLNKGGQLRAWFKLWCLLLLYTSIPILLITPILSFLIHEFNGISSYLLLTSRDLFYSILYISGGIVTLILLLLFIRKLLRLLIVHLLQ